MQRHGSQLKTDVVIGMGCAAAHANVRVPDCKAHLKQRALNPPKSPVDIGPRHFSQCQASEVDARFHHPRRANQPSPQNWRSFLGP